MARRLSAEFGTPHLAVGLDEMKHVDECGAEIRPQPCALRITQAFDIFSCQSSQLPEPAVSGQSDITLVGQRHRKEDPFSESRPLSTKEQEGWAKAKERGCEASRKSRGNRCGK
jgi:hypothetical protein